MDHHGPDPNINPIDTTTNGSTSDSIDVDTFATSIAEPALTVFEAPAEAKGNGNYSVHVRYEGGEWINLFEYEARYGVSGGGRMAFVSFVSDFSKKIEVKVEKKNGSMAEAQIRPEMAGVLPVVDGKAITFSLTSPQKLCVELPDNFSANLMIFADKPDSIDISKYSRLVFWARHS